MNSQTLAPEAVTAGDASHRPAAPTAPAESLRWLAWLTALVLLAAVVRLVPVPAHLPVVTNVDESFNLVVISDMVRRSSANPEFFGYPSLFWHLYAGTHVVAGWAAGFGGGLDGMAGFGAVETQARGVTRAVHPLAFEVARVTTVLLGVALVLATGWVAWLLSRDRRAQLLAVAAAAVSPVLVLNGGLATPDTLSGLMATLAVGSALLAGKNRTNDRYVVAGMMIGLSACAKYNAGSVAVVLVVIWLTDRERSWTQIVAAAAAAVVTVILVMPWIVTDTAAVVDGIGAEVDHYRSGHPGNEGGSPGQYLSWLWAATGPLLILFPVVPLVRRRVDGLAVFVYAVLYFLLVASQQVRFERNLLPLVPSVLALGSVGAIECWDRWSRPGWGRVPGVALAGALVVWLLPATVAELGAAWDDRGRAAAAAWIEERYQPGDVVLTDLYGPFLELPAGSVRYEGNSLLLEPDPETTAMVIVTQEGSGRFLTEESGYGRMARAHADTLLESACERASFAGDSVWVFRLDCG